ncbi:serine/threonine-protein kinase [Myxosarcina sp. GI1]|uniref:serine/threonine-protein kinase n=1 Tax=Myxosarcina sp. GI1 TaxID=1541065 RepID=UPI00068F4FA1|nr:serine/threonine-protein kinase [Myxosarcina sp. GI1]
MQGKILGSRYQVIEFIGKGGFGKTYLAEDTLLPGRDKCVVKQLYPSVDDVNFVKTARRLFKTEAETLHSLGSHDQIPQLLAYFEEEEKFYLVQQYVEGHTLSKALVPGQTWSEAKVIELLRDCANILNFIHSKGVIHRDIKPDNLICRNSDNKLVLVDFGSVKEVIVEQTQLLPSTVAVGTRGYMPMEQARGMPRPTSDIYALGIIGIQALAGMSPLSLPEDDDGELIWQDRAEVSPQLAEILNKMTRSHFKQRYQSAREVLDSLDSLCMSRVIPQNKAAGYTPTAKLNFSQIADMAEATPPDSVVEVPTVVNNLPTVVNSTTSTNSAQSKSTILPPSNLQQRSQPNENPSSSIANESSNSVTKTKNLDKYKTLATLGTAVVIGAIATGGMYLLKQKTITSNQKSVDEQIAEFEKMLETKSFDKCYDRATKMATEAKASENITIPEAQRKEFEAKCGLASAKKEADNLKYIEALAIAKALPSKTSIDAEIQQQKELWSEKVLQQANNLYNKEGKLQEALELAEQIPQDTAIRQKVIDAKNSWKAEHETNEVIITSAQEALSEEKWQYAKQEATKVKDSPSSYWRERAKAIISQAEEGIAAATSTPEPNTPAQKPDTIQPEPPTATKPEPKPTEPPKNEEKPGLPDYEGELRDLSGDSTATGNKRLNNTNSDELRDLSNDYPSVPEPTIVPSPQPQDDSMRDL